MNAEFTQKMLTPQEVKEIYPLTPAMAEEFSKRSQEIIRVCTGEDQRMLLIVGPCSADNGDAVLDYMDRLAALQEEVQEKFLFVPRVYTAKSRSTSLGYKGMQHQPNPMDAPDMLQGVKMSRLLFLRVLEQSGFLCADEMLYTQSYKYFDDVLGYVAVGARSVENQEHRLTASALSIPVGMKNPLTGNIEAMLNAVRAAQHPHDFIYRNWEAHSKGNPYAHAVLRGYTTRDGHMYPNYSREDLYEVIALYEKMQLSNPMAIVDTNHANSQKHYEKQIDIAHEVIEMRNVDSKIKGFVRGLMIESYLVDGCQDPAKAVYGQSITDPCLGWEKTERLIRDLAERA